MAEEEVEVNAELVICDSKEVSLPMDETEREVEEGPEKVLNEVAPVTLESEDAPDCKRKLEDHEPLLENDEPLAKRQEIYVSEPSIEQHSPTTDEVKEAPEIETEETGIEADGSGYHSMEEPVADADVGTSDAVVVSSVVHGDVNEEYQGHDGEVDGLGTAQLKFDSEPVGNGQIPSTENIQHISVDDRQNSSSPQGHQDNFPHVEQQASSDLLTSCKVEVPSNKVGVLIGKSGDTIRYLQQNSGAKIQITRDSNSDTQSSTRLVELIGTLESINRAEKLIKDVLAESEAGGSPSLVARGLNNLGGEQIEISIPDEKVGVVIGKGGETIKNLQRKSGARIQLLPQHLPDGDSSKGRMVRITGNKKQVESARELIKIVLNQGPYRPSSLSGAYNQHAFRAPRGPPPAHQWAPRGARPPHQQTSYDYPPRGMYPPQTTQYSQSYSGYPQHQPPQKGWDQQKSAAATSQTPSPGGYDYYNHGAPTSNPYQSAPTGQIPAFSPAPINYGHSQAPDGYGHPSAYSHAPQPSYGQGYGEPKYDNQPPPQIYGQQPAAAQPGMYAQQSSAPYGKLAYAAPHEAPPAYGQPRGTQPDPMYQNPPPSQYPSTAPAQQGYPYGTSAPTQQAPPYGQAYGPPSAAADPYSQQPSAGYPSQGYSAQATPVYTQPAAQPGGYSQYPSSQATYGDQTAQASANYGYQGGAPEAGYAGNAASSGYAAASAPQPVSANPSGYYDQSNPPQAGYAAAVPAAPASYANAGAAQPGYNGQYDASQMYGHH